MPTADLGAVDIHTHILPGIDDGSADEGEFLRMAAAAERAGTAVVVSTPHRFWDGRQNTAKAILELAARMDLAARDAGLRVRIAPGQEVALEQRTADDLHRGALLTYGDEGSAVLVEPPFDELPSWTASALRDIVDAGFRAILAHPERNAQMSVRPEIAEEFTSAGACLQVTAMSVTGDNGPRIERAAHWMLERNLVFAVASDAHSPGPWRPPDLSRAHALIANRYGGQLARDLCVTNPASLITRWLSTSPAVQAGQA